MLQTFLPWQGWSHFLPKTGVHFSGKWVVSGALHFAHYNLVRLHKTLRVTPALAANVTDRVWSLEELVDRTSK